MLFIKYYWTNPIEEGVVIMHRKNEKCVQTVFWKLKPVCTWGDTTKMDIKGIECEGVS